MRIQLTRYGKALWERDVQQCRIKRETAQGMKDHVHHKCCAGTMATSWNHPTGICEKMRVFTRGTITPRF